MQALPNRLEADDETAADGAVNRQRSDDIHLANRHRAQPLRKRRIGIGKDPRLPFAAADEGGIDRSAPSPTEYTYPGSVFLGITPFFRTDGTPNTSALHALSLPATDSIVP
ncbi:MAG: hypothetical protein ACI4R9_01105 [Kiritimatiellia bacterium]